MAVSTTTFAQRMDKINSGKTTSWTVPGQGLATTSDERSFLGKSKVKTLKRSTQKKTGPMMLVLLAVFGFISVFLGRWLDFMFTDGAIAMAADAGFDPTEYIPRDLTAPAYALLLGMIVTQINGLKGMAVKTMTAGFAVALFAEGQFVQMAPDLFQMVYSPAQIALIMDSTNYLG